MRLLLILSLMLLTGIAQAQQGRVIGARAFQIDDGSGSGKTVTLDVLSALSSSYQLHFPNASPANPANFLMSDATGHMSWIGNTLPPLASGNIWRGNSLGIASAMPPGAAGSILSIDGSSMPKWTTTIPSQITISASQITSDTLAPATTIVVGSGASIQPAGSGKIVANQLSGAGVNKYSGSVAIPQDALILAITYSGATASSVIMASIIDPSGQTDQVSIGQITPGVGFTVIFTGYYPSATGKINYLIIN